jgi:hypothetical protein
LWHVNLLQGGDREIGDCTAAVVRQWPTNNRVILFSGQSARQQLDTTVMYATNRHERRNGTQQRNGVFYAVRVDIL